MKALEDGMGSLRTYQHRCLAIATEKHVASNEASGPNSAVFGRDTNRVAEKIGKKLRQPIRVGYT